MRWSRTLTADEFLLHLPLALPRTLELGELHLTAKELLLVSPSRRRPEWAEGAKCSKPSTEFGKISSVFDGRIGSSRRGRGVR